MIDILPLKEVNIKAVVGIEDLSFTAPKAEEVFFSDQNKYLIAVENDEVLGYIGIERISGEIHIINMAVHPDYRGRGIGKKLVENVLNDKDVFFLEVRVSNLAAQKLYGKYGFKVVGTRKKYYQDNDEDAYIMKREANV